MSEDKAKYSASVLRLFLGPLFVIPGIMKLMAPEGIIGMLGNLGFPAASFLGWVLILSEIVFGAAILVGYKLKLTVWPMVVVMVVALLTVAVPNMSQPMGQITVLFHLAAIGGLLSLYFSGPGAYAFGNKS